MRTLKIFSFLYLFAVLGLFLYSFTQVDLSLTFSRIEFLRNITSWFQHIGYFDRPLSTYLYVSLLIALYSLYGYLLFAAIKNKLTTTFVWRLIMITTGILLFSYNAFSYDIFNYIFDAKILTHYHQNPYLHKALDFPTDPMLSFMRWTHRVYPYGPLWLAITVPLSFVGFGIFLPTFFLFKSLMAASFIGTLYFMQKILRKIAPEKEVFGLIFLGLSPFMLIEYLVSAHLDIVMMFFATWAFYLLIQKRLIWAWVLLLISIGIKFATVFIVPVFLMVTILQIKHKKFSWNAVVLWSIVLLLGATLTASLRTNFQPWYLLEPLIFAAFLSWRYFIFIPSIVLTFFALLTYVPYLYVGNWDKPIPQNLTIMYLISYASSLLIVCGVFVSRRLKK